jgi:preprotein translocase subunit SecG
MRRRLPRRLLATLTCACLALLVLAPAAFAAALSGGLDGGQGVYKGADDKVVTKAGFILIAFFPLLILTLSLLQWRLDKRKAARKAAAKHRLASADWHGGW